MRLATLATLALALLAPGAAAQSPTATLAVEAGVVDAPLDPLGGSVTVPVRVTVPCRHLAAPGSAVALSIAEAPTWLGAILAPERIAIDPAGCATLEYVGEATLTLRATEDAPAFVATALAVVASVSSAAGEERAEGVAIVQAGYFSRLGAEVTDAPDAVGTDRIAEFSLRLANAGNAMTKVAFEPVSVPAGWTFPLPQPVTLESRQQGGALTEQTVRLVVQSPVKRSECAGISELALRLQPAYALDSREKGDPVALAVEVRCERDASVPAPAAVAVLAACAGAAVLLGRRSKPF